MKKSNILAELFMVFAKIGAFTFGGGYAMIALIKDNCIEKKKWITHDEMMDVTVIAESTPGPIAINCATYVGYKQAGLIGAIISTLGFILPSFVIIYCISMFLDNFLEIAFIANAFKGIKLAVGVLILDAGIEMVKKMQKKPIPKTIMVCSLICMFLINLFSLKFSSTSLMLVAGAVSLTIFLVQQNKQKNGKGGQAK